VKELVHLNKIKSVLLGIFFFPICSVVHWQDIPLLFARYPHEFTLFLFPVTAVFLVMRAGPFYAGHESALNAILPEMK
jgi:hypothetical protein